MYTVESRGMVSTANIVNSVNIINIINKQTNKNVVRSPIPYTSLLTHCSVSLSNIEEQIGTRERNKERKCIAKNKKEKGIKKENVLPRIRKRKE